MTMIAREPTMRELLDVAMDAAYLAGKLTLAYFNTGVRPDFKSDATPVTIADREAEKLLRARILSAFPEHAVLGEEEGATGAEDAEYRWIVDPIDGTKAFVAGVPLYGVLVGVEVRGEPSVGVIYLPGVGDMVAAASGLGCTWNGRPCRVSEVAHLSDSLLLTSSIVRCQARSDAFGYALVATGRAEVMIDPAISPWDCAPMLPILREAGGRFSDWKGNDTIHGPDSVATNGVLYEQVLDILANERRRKH